MNKTEFPHTDEENSSDQPKKKISIVAEYAQAAAVALCLALFFRTFFIQAFKIPSESMLETLLVGDQLLAFKFSYGVRIPFTQSYLYKGDDPKRGDIIIFEYPEDPDIDFIKRIIGLPGDTIEIRDKRLLLNGKEFYEPYVRHSEPDMIYAKRDNFGPITVPADEYFVMGDNRDNSHDSRFWGCVKRGAIKAKAWRIYWSWGNGGFSAIRWSRMGQEVK